MRAVVVTKQAPVESGPLEVVELPVPRPEPDELLVRVLYCGVCRTDLHIVEGDLPLRRTPTIPGHQVVGVVEDAGAQCRRFHLGDRVGIAWLRWTCGECKFCRRERENLCPRARFTGYDAPGGFAEYTVVPEAFAYPLGEAFDAPHAAPLLCAGIIGFRALKRANVPSGGRLGLIGFGSSAHITLQVALARGYRCYVISRGEAHQKLARRLGAIWAGRRLEALPYPLDAAILFAPVGDLVPATMRVLDRGGTLSIAGIHLTHIPSLRYSETLFFERDLRSVTANTRQDGLQLLSEAARIGLQPEVEIYPLEEAGRALEDLKHSRISGTAVLRVAER